MKENDKHKPMDFYDFIRNFEIRVEKKEIESDYVRAKTPYKRKGLILVELLNLIVEHKASDLHINSGEKPVVRIHGDLKFLDIPVFTNDDLKELLYPLLLPEKLANLEEKGYIDFAYDDIKLGRFRINFYKHIRGLGASFRHIPKDIPRLEDLNLPSVISNITKFKKGLVLITGPTGSGKSTTLASIIDAINSNQKKHIITIEDPLEFIHLNKKSRLTHREVGEHANDFSSAIISAMRADPDVLVIGEIRDQETISQALRAAETGILVLTTLHTNSAAKSIDRIINLFPAEHQSQVRIILSEVLRAVVSQQLMKRADYAGRIPAVEILFANQGLANLIREGKTYYINSMIHTSRESGMQSMDYELYRLYKEGKVSFKDAKTRCVDLKYFEQLEGGK